MYCIFRLLILIVSTALLAGCNDNEHPQMTGPPLDPVKTEVLGINLGSDYLKMIHDRLDEFAKPHGGLFERSRDDASKRYFVWLAGYGLPSNEKPFPPDTLFAVLSPRLAGNTVLAIFRKLDFANGTSGAKPKPSSAQLLSALLEKYGTPTGTSPEMKTKEEFIERVQTERSQSEFIWVTSNDPSANCSYAASIWEIPDLSKLGTRTEAEEVYRSFYYQANNSKACGRAIRARIATSDVRDKASDLSIYMVDYLAADVADNKDRSEQQARLKAEEEATRLYNESRPTAAVPRL
jgi:hypothetical protein